MKDPMLIALALMILSAGLFVAGVQILAGPGWALIAAAVPVLSLSLIIAKGAVREAGDG